MLACLLASSSHDVSARVGYDPAEQDAPSLNTQKRGYINATTTYFCMASTEGFSGSQVTHFSPRLFFTSRIRIATYCVKARAKPLKKARLCALGTILIKSLYFSFLSSQLLFTKIPASTAIYYCHEKFAYPEISQTRYITSRNRLTTFSSLVAVTITVSVVPTPLQMLFMLSLNQGVVQTQ